MSVVVETTIASTPDPWTNWRQQLPQCQPVPLDERLETAIDVAIAAADRRRLDLVPTTTHFTLQWNEFRQQHELLESTEYRRHLRALIWRAAVLKVMIKQQHFQDIIDFNQCRDALDATERKIGGATDLDDWLWKAPAHEWADAPRSPHTLCIYAASVLSLAKATYA
jgi:hypothetical protein